MTTEATGVGDKILLGVVLIFLAMALGLTFWATFKRYDANAPGFPPGWHCIDLGRGGYYCEKRRSFRDLEPPRAATQ